MGFKKQTTTKPTKQIRFKHVMLLCGYEFRNMNKKQVYEYLNEKNIYYDNNSNIYDDGENVMYQLIDKIYDNEIDIIE